MKDTVAVIGIENEEGRELARKFAKGNCRLLIYSNDLSAAHSALKMLIDENPGLEAEVMDCKVTASWEADLIIISVSEEKIGEIAGEIKPVACQKTIVIPQSISADKISMLLPYCKIISIGNNLVISGKDNESVQSVKSILSAV